MVDLAGQLTYFIVLVGWGVDPENIESVDIHPIITVLHDCPFWHSLYCFISLA